LENWKTVCHPCALIRDLWDRVLFIVVEHVLPEQYEIKLGQVSPATKVSPVTRVDQFTTEQAAVKRLYQG
jgi:membrane-associated HD superfamily phosphohydrolase